MALNEYDSYDANDNSSFYADEFGERISSDQNYAGEGVDEGDTLDTDALAEDELVGATAQADQHENDFHESLQYTDQFGDEQLMREAEKDYQSNDTQIETGRE